MKESHQFILPQSGSLGEFIQGNYGKLVLSHAVERVRRALAATGPVPPSLEKPDLPSDRLGVQREVTSFLLARILVSCAREKALMERLARYEAQRAHAFLQAEDEGKRKFLAEKMGYPLDGPFLPVPRYIGLTAGLQEERWRLVNREVYGGKVTVEPAESEELFREHIRKILLSSLPLEVPESVCTLVEPYISQVRAEFQKRILTDFGQVEESAFPPCMQALLSALSAGTNITHAGRFALTAFLHNIGMGTSEIIQLYSRAPDFDIGKTQYQVEHISGRGGKGTEYTAPACPAMRTLGLCARPDTLCEKVSHPLTYYRRKKKGRKGGERDTSGDGPVDENTRTAHREDEYDEGKQVRGPVGEHCGEEDHERDEDGETE
ncbi:MAG: DNA primase large subunit PriL [Methanolinea sp.]|nr:DNA primase large subunit PriL [Methanolinea sp.]